VIQTEIIVQKLQRIQIFMLQPKENYVLLVLYFVLNKFYSNYI